MSAQEAGWGVEASTNAETLFTGFTGPGGGVGSGRSLVPRHREDIRRECCHGCAVVAAFPRDGEREGSGDGGRRPRRLAGRRDWLVARIAEKPDLRLRALLAELAADGVKVSHGALWAFFAREGITFRKRPCTPVSRTAPTLPAGARGGGNTRAGLMPNAWS